MLNMTQKEKIRLLRERFVHRSDTFAIQWLAKDSGEWRFWRVTTGPQKRSEPLHDNQLASHLEQTRTLGVYQLADDDSVKWLCLDVDINKGEDSNDERLGQLVREHTKALGRTLRRMGIPFLVEFSGNRGYHVWVFFSEPVEAATAMSFGRYVSEHVFPPEQLHVEVFPKQTSQGAAFGNLVKLPLGIHQKTRQLCQFVDSNFDVLPDQWGALLHVPHVTAAELDGVIEKHDIPLIDTTRLSVRSGSGRMGLPCMTNIMDSGAGQGKRDLVTYKLACFLRNAGIPSDLALAMLDEWNVRNKPPLDLSTLTLKVESAYSTDYSSFPCQDTAFDEFCSSTCRFYAEKMRTRGLRTRK